MLFHLWTLWIKNLNREEPMWLVCAPAWNLSWEYSRGWRLTWVDEAWKFLKTSSLAYLMPEPRWCSWLGITDLSRFSIRTSPSDSSKRPHPCRNLSMVRFFTRQLRILTASALAKPGGSWMIFYHLPLKIRQCYSHCALWVGTCSAPWDSRAGHIDTVFKTCYI